MEEGGFHGNFMKNVEQRQQSMRCSVEGDGCRCSYSCGLMHSSSGVTLGKGQLLKPESVSPNTAAHVTAGVTGRCRQVTRAVLSQ